MSLVLSNMGIKGNGSFEIGSRIKLQSVSCDQNTRDDECFVLD